MRRSFLNTSGTPKMMGDRMASNRQTRIGGALGNPKIQTIPVADRYATAESQLAIGRRLVAYVSHLNGFSPAASAMARYSCRASTIIAATTNANSHSGALNTIS